MTPTLDTKSLLRRFGSVSDLQLQLELQGLPVPKAATVRQWYARRSIPTDWLATLVKLAECNGEKLDIAEFITNGE